MMNQANKTKTKRYIQAHTYVNFKYMHRPINLSYNTQQFFQACFPAHLLKTLPKRHAMEEALLVSTHLYRNCCCKPHTVSTLSTWFYKLVQRLWKPLYMVLQVGAKAVEASLHGSTSGCKGCGSLSTWFYKWVLRLWKQHC